MSEDGLVATAKKREKRKERMKRVNGGWFVVGGVKISRSVHGSQRKGLFACV